MLELIPPPGLPYPTFPAWQCEVMFVMGFVCLVQTLLVALPEEWTAWLRK